VGEGEIIVVALATLTAIVATRREEDHNHGRTPVFSQMRRGLTVAAKEKHKDEKAYYNLHSPHLLVLKTQFSKMYRAITLRFLTRKPAS
jgi:hypothetical protein